MGICFSPLGNNLSCTETVCVYIMGSLYTDQQRPMLAGSFFFFQKLDFCLQTTYLVEITKVSP